MNGYPVLLNLHHRSVVMVGGGRVAGRKVAGLLDAGACVTVISPALHPSLMKHVKAMRHIARSYQPGMLAELHPVLVFAATDTRRVNQAVADEAEVLGVLVNVVDDPTASGFSNMLTVQRPPLTVALATDGASPALAAQLKTRLEQAITEDDAVLARWLSELRPLVKACLQAQSEREQFWHALLASTAPALVRAGNTIAAYNVVENLLQTSAIERR